MEYVTDINEIFRIFEECGKKAVYKSIGTDEEGNEVAVPVFAMAVGFLSTVEGCTLKHCDKTVYEQAREVFQQFSPEEKDKLAFAPEDGGFVDRINFWKRELKPAMSGKHYRIAIAAILHWYIHIKRLKIADIAA